MQKHTLFFYLLMFGSTTWIGCDSGKNPTNDTQHIQSDQAPSSKYIKDPEKLKITYPQTKKGSVVDNFFVNAVADPYR